MKRKEAAPEPAPEPAPAIGEDLLPQLKETLREIRSDTIDGLEDLQRTTVSDELKAKIEEQLAALAAFGLMVDTVIADIAKLNADLEALRNAGWPDLPRIELSQTLTAELDDELRHLRAGAEIFTEAAPAAGFEVETDPPTPNP